MRKTRKKDIKKDIKINRKKDMKITSIRLDGFYPLIPEKIKMSSDFSIFEGEIGTEPDDILVIFNFIKNLIVTGNSVSAINRLPNKIKKSLKLNYLPPIEIQMDFLISNQEVMYTISFGEGFTILEEKVSYKKYQLFPLLKRNEEGEIDLTYEKFSPSDEEANEAIDFRKAKKEKLVSKTRLAVACLGDFRGYTSPIIEKINDFLSEIKVCDHFNRQEMIANICRLDETTFKQVAKYLTGINWFCREIERLPEGPGHYRSLRIKEKIKRQTFYFDDEQIRDDVFEYISYSYLLSTADMYPVLVFPLTNVSSIFVDSFKNADLQCLLVNKNNNLFSFKSEKGVEILSRETHIE